MRYTLLAGHLLALGLAGCVTPAETVTRAVGVAQVADRVECDLKAFYLANIKTYPWLSTWAASFNLTLKQEDVVGATPSVGYRVPLALNQKFGLDAGGEIRTTGGRTLSTKRTVLLQRLIEYQCKDVVVPGSPLTSNLGLMEPLGEALLAYGSDDVINKVPDDLGYRIDFAFKIEGHVNPLVILYRITGVGLNFEASRESTNSLEIAFADASPRGPQPVFVTNWPRDFGLAQSGTPSTRKRQPAQRMRINNGRPTLTPDVRSKLDGTLQRLQLETLLPRRF